MNYPALDILTHSLTEVHTCRYGTDLPQLDVDKRTGLERKGDVVLLSLDLRIDRVGSQISGVASHRLSPDSTRHYFRILLQKILQTKSTGPPAAALWRKPEVGCTNSLQSL